MNTTTCLALITLPLAACANTPAQHDADTSGWKLSVFSEETELDELEFTDPGFAELTLEDKNRQRSGLEASYGSDAVRGLVRVYKEDFLDDSIGIGVGVEGRPHLTTLDWSEAGVDLLLDYGLQFGVTSDSEVTVGGSEGDMAYVDATSRLGLAFDLHNGLTPSFGIVHHALEGSIEFEGEADHDWEDSDFDGSYTSGYLGLDYRVPDSNVDLGLRGLVGEASSVGMAVTWSL